MLAPSGTDSILGIASGICGSAVARALTSSTSLPRSSTPMSPPTFPAAEDPGSAHAPAPSPPVTETPEAELGGTGMPTNTALHAASAPAAPPDEGSTPEESGRPSLRRTPPEATPRDVAPHPISSTSFRVTDSCADRVWRMLQGGVEQAARMSPTEEEEMEDRSEDADRRDSMSVPDFPSLDEAAYAQLEAEALQAPNVAADALAPPEALMAALERPSTPTAPSKLALASDCAPVPSGPGDSPSLQPTFCESPGLNLRRGGRRGGSSAPRSPTPHAVSAAQADELRQTAITDTLVNQSLRASVAFPGATADGTECDENLLDAMLEGDSAEPDALPSPSHLHMDASPYAPASVQRAPSESGGRDRRKSEATVTPEMPRPATSTFDAAAIVSTVRSHHSNSDSSAKTRLRTAETRLCCVQSERRRAERSVSGAERPKTAGARPSCVAGFGSATTRPSTSAGRSSRRTSHTPPTQVTPLSGSRPQTTTSKRTLSHKTIHNITPNHNPNYQPHSPGKTPQAVPPNASPIPKRSRSHTSGEQERLEQPLDLGLDLPDVDDASILDSARRSAPGSGEPLLRGRASTGKVTPPFAHLRGRESTGPGRGRSSMPGEPTTARSLRDSLLTLDPMRLSYGLDGLVNLAGAAS